MIPLVKMTGTEKDVKVVMDVNRSLSMDSSKEEIRNAIQDPNQIYYITPWGYARLGKCSSDEMNIGIMLFDFYTGKGYGEKVLDALTVLAKEKGIRKLLWTADKENERSVRFALKHGFEIQENRNGKVRLIKNI